MIDLLSERHMLLRRIMENEWDALSDIPIANSEWYIISRIYKQETTISNISKSVNISRQATHKAIKKLEEKQLVEVSDHEHNKKLKNIKLTQLGERCFEQYSTIVQRLELQISSKIGEESLTVLKNILKLDWELTLEV